MHVGVHVQAISGILTRIGKTKRSALGDHIVHQRRPAEKWVVSLLHVHSELSSAWTSWRIRLHGNWRELSSFGLTWKDHLPTDCSRTIRRRAGLVDSEYTGRSACMQAKLAATVVCEPRGGLWLSQILCKIFTFSTFQFLVSMFFILQIFPCMHLFGERLSRLSP
jgi:hypothetical protein